MIVSEYYRGDMCIPDRYYVPAKTYDKVLYELHRKNMEGGEMDKNGVQLVLRKLEYDGFNFEILAVGDPGDMSLIMRVHDYDWGTIHEYKEDSIYYNLCSAMGEAVQNALDELRAAKRDARGDNDADVEGCEFKLASLIRAVKAIVR